MLFGYLLCNVIDYGVDLFDVCYVCGKLVEVSVMFEVCYSVGLLFVSVIDDGLGVDMDVLCVVVVC